MTTVDPLDMQTIIFVGYDGLEKTGKPILPVALGMFLSSSVRKVHIIIVANVVFFTLKILFHKRSSFLRFYLVKNSRKKKKTLGGSATPIPLDHQARHAVDRGNKFRSSIDEHH